MLSSDLLKDVVHKEGLGRKEQTLLLLAVDADEPKTVSKIRQIAVGVGLRSVQKWNMSSVLARTEGLAVRMNDGWVLTVRGKDYLRTRELISVDSVAVGDIISDLRQRLPGISDPNTRSFVEEAIGCLEAGLFRAAVVLSWVGAMSLVYDEVVKNHLAAFNAEAKRRAPKWRAAANADDLARMKEHDFLNVLEAISVLGKNVKQELQNNCLKLRNACGHPNSLKVGQNRVAAHIEILVQNIFSKF